MKTRFAIRPFETHTIMWWYTHRRHIDLSPSFQRKGGLWTQAEKAYLVDSVINEFDIPKIYIADFTYFDSALNENGLRYAIIDGKQRLEALFEFLEGKVELDENIIFYRNPLIRLRGMTFFELRDFHPDIAQEVEQFPINVMSVITNDESKITELFLRLNRSKPLTGAEIRNAMQGSVPELIRMISKHQFFTSRVRFSKTRGQDLNAAAKLLLVEFVGDFTDTKKVDLNRFAEEGVATQNQNIHSAAKRVLEVLEYMCGIFMPNDKILKSAGQLPVYYWFARTYLGIPGKSIQEFLYDFSSRLDLERKSPDLFPDYEWKHYFESYLRFNRNVNDIGILRGRFSVLSNLFSEYVDEKDEIRQLSLM